MRKSKTAIMPGVDEMESRVLLSGARPLLSRHTLSGVVHDVKAIVNTLAKTGNSDQASSQLTTLSCGCRREP